MRSSNMRSFAKQAKSSTFETFRGMHDHFTKSCNELQFIEQSFKTRCELHNFGEIRTPIVEHRSLFERTLGSASDIISHEMFEVIDDTPIILRPENTASESHLY